MSRKDLSKTIVHPVRNRRFSIGALSVGVLAMVFLISFVVMAWTEPGAIPPGGNVPVPINVGSSDQWKEGKLGIAASGVDTNYGLTVGSGVKITNIGTQPSFYVEDASGDSTPFIIDDTGNVGIGTTSPEFKLSLNNDGGIIAKGTYGSGATLTTSGEGTRLIWYPRKAAFRAGYVSVDQWDDANIGGYSVAMGTRTRASGVASLALGGYTTASGSFSTAIGFSTEATGNRSTAIGYETVASGIGSTALGAFTRATGNYSTAMGRSIEAQGDYSFGIGLDILADPYRVITQANTMAIMGGKVGIATTTPTYELDVAGQIHSTGDICTDAGGGVCLSTGGGAADDDWTGAGTGSMYTTYLTDNVGIGTTGPGGQLSVGGWDEGGSGTAGGRQLLLGGAVNSGVNANGYKLFIRGYDNDDTSYTYPIYVQDENGYVDFWLRGAGSEGGSNTMYVRGNVGIGTTEPVQKLTVSGNIAGGRPAVRMDISSGNLYANSITGIEMWGDDQNTYGSRYGEMMIYGRYISFRSGKTTTGGAPEVMRINPDGNLTVTGDLTVSGTGGNVCHDVDGTWYSCPAAAAGDITAVYSGEGTKGGGASGDVTIEFDCSEVASTGLACSGEDIYISTTYQGADARCSGTTTYLDGDGNCDDISGVYVDQSGDTMTGDLSVSGTILAGGFAGPRLSIVTGPGTGADNQWHEVTCPSGYAMTGFSVYIGTHWDGNLSAKCVKVTGLIDNTDQSWTTGSGTGDNTWHSASCGAGYIATGIRAYASSRLDTNLALRCTKVTVSSTQLTGAGYTAWPTADVNDYTHWAFCMPGSFVRYVKVWASSYLDNQGQVECTTIYP